MPLKTLVKVGSVSNLSDARYCAGMGVEMLGFRVIEGQEHYLSSELYQQIRGWVSGPKFVAEVYGLTPDIDLSVIFKNYVPDFVELDWKAYQQFQHEFTLPCIVSISVEELIAQSQPANSNIAYWIVDGDTATKEILDIYKGSIPVLLSIASKDELPLRLAYKNVKGITLNGTSEIRPGFKNYDALADVLEALDEF
jgi:phosphoribosylanthranilate isomerase